MNDRQWLEMAAKAVNSKNNDNLSIIWSEIWQCFVNVSAEHDCHLHLPRWNPLKSNSDALQLAVTLGIDIGFGWEGDRVVCVLIDSVPTYSDDMFFATRSVIVRAAAEIGKAMS